MRRHCALVLLALLAAPAAAAAPPTIGDAWIRALPEGLPAAGYFTLHNGTGHALTLIGASTPACSMAMLHRSESANGMSSMRDAPAIDIPAGGTLRFAPGGYHIMCMGPGAAVKPGGTVTMTLRFRDGTHVSAPFAVRGAAGK